MPGTTAQTEAQPVYTPILACRSCGGREFDYILSLGDQYLVGFVSGIDKDLPHAPLDLIRCSGCGLLQLSGIVNPALLWGEEYWYRSSINQSMRNALTNVAKHGVSYHGKGTWLDIGANDGWLLSRVPGTFKKLACEPSKPFHPRLEEHSDRVIPTFFSAKSVAEPCDVITSCAMFYDLDDPRTFLDDIKTCLKPDGVWINQLSDTKSMFKNNDFGNIVHEHRIYWDLAGLIRIYREHGLKVIAVSHNDVNGGSVRLVAKRGDAVGAAIAAPPPLSLEEAQAFAQRVGRWQERMREILSVPSIAYRPLWAYAASTKGCCMLQYLDCNDQFIAIADRNPVKHGTYMTGSWLPITGESELREAKPHTVLALAYAFRDEFLEREAALRSSGTAFIFPLPDISLIL